MFFGVVSLFGVIFCFFFQAEDGIRDAQESRGLGDVYKRQGVVCLERQFRWIRRLPDRCPEPAAGLHGNSNLRRCLLYTSDAADDLLCVDLGGRRIIKKKKYSNVLTHNPLHTTTHLPYNLLHTHRH